MDYNLVNFDKHKNNEIKKTTAVNLILSNEEKKQLLGFNDRDNECKKAFLKELHKQKQIKAQAEEADLNNILKIFLDKYKIGELYSLILPRYNELIKKYDKLYFVTQGEPLCNFIVRRILLELEMMEYRDKLPGLNSQDLDKYSSISNNSVSESLNLANKLYSSIKEKELGLKYNGGSIVNVEPHNNLTSDEDDFSDYDGDDEW